MFQQDELGLCVADGQDAANPSSDLDPDKECAAFDRFRFISSCKNNCKGGQNQSHFIREHRNLNCKILVNYSVVSGGAALIGGSLIAATGLFTPAVGALVFGNNRVMINIIQRDNNNIT